MDDLWAVIPVAGAGSRLRPHTHTRPKPLLHVGGQPILGHILDALAAARVARVVLVVGQMGEQIVEYVGGRGDFDVVVPVTQTERLGLGHAISLVGETVGADPILVVYGDTIFRADLERALGGSADAVLGVMQVPDPTRFGVVVEEGGRVTRLVEKPREFVSDRAIVGVNYVRASGMLFQCLEELIGSARRTRGEYQLTDAFQMMVERGADVRTFPVDAWYDCGTQASLLESNRYLLENGAGRTDGGVGENCVILPPVYVDPTARVSDSVLGPYVSIGGGARVSRVVGRNMIIGAGAEVEDVLLQDTLIGYQAVVRGSVRRLNVGDLSEVEL